MDASTILAQYGLAGLVIFIEAGVIMVLWKMYQEALNKLLDLQEARRIETLARETKLVETMGTFSQSTELLLDKIVDVQQSKGRR